MDLDTARRLFFVIGLALLAQNLFLLNWHSDVVANLSSCSADVVDGWERRQGLAVAHQLSQAARHAAVAQGIEAAKQVEVARSEEQRQHVADKMRHLAGSSHQEVTVVVPSPPPAVQTIRQTPAPPAPPVIPAAPPAVATGPKAGKGRRKQLVPSTAQHASHRLLREGSWSFVERNAMRIFGGISKTRRKLCIGVTSYARGNLQPLKDTVQQLLGSSGGPGPQGGASLSRNDQSTLMVVVHLADQDEEWIQSATSMLMTNFEGAVSEGQLHAVRTPADLYPPTNVCPPFCPGRASTADVAKHSRNNLDTGLLMYYAASFLGVQYYLQLEDDVLFNEGWYQRWQDFVRVRYPEGYKSKDGNAPWRVVDIAGASVGLHTCLGKFLQFDELERLSAFLLLFYDQMPCQVLIDKWMRAMTQGKPADMWKASGQSMLRNPAIGGAGAAGGGEANFVTCGNHRAATCAGCPQGQGASWCNVDCAWVAEDCVPAPAANLALGPVPQPAKLPEDRLRAFNNPVASVIMQGEFAETYDPRFIYFPGGEPTERHDDCDFGLSKVHMRGGQQYQYRQCWLWMKGVRSGHHITLVLRQSVNAEDIYVQFGAEMHMGDLLLNGELQVAADNRVASGSGSQPASEPGLDKCGTFHTLRAINSQPVVEWTRHRSQPPELPTGSRLKCLRIFVRADQREWLVVQRVLLNGQP
eukprot:TRINITY_DN60861_c0_g1_i1.p1 TRINITY_DN60861_c0_g1~~TRINITY_DN60861_c0_g1_i1.p1  ORF type:complete len:719 (-),score=118.62 TRINITY_DN60861_c0_g1_i1:821-2908(-)